jgi:hypothetical protein
MSWVYVYRYFGLLYRYCSLQYKTEVLKIRIGKNIELGEKKRQCLT